MRSQAKLITPARVISLLVLIAGLNAPYQLLDAFAPQPSYAQTPEPQELWQRVYQQLPNLPLENKHISKETGKVAQDSNLVTRLLQYHLYVKGRAPNYRLDWKLTLADYLGANELISETVYPGNDTLLANPLESDRQAIAKLSRQQRNDLIQTLVSLFAQNEQDKPNSVNNTPERAIAPSPSPAPNSPLQPRPGDAERLKL